MSPWKVILSECSTSFQLIKSLKEFYAQLLLQGLGRYPIFMIFPYKTADFFFLRASCNLQWIDYKCQGCFRFSTPQDTNLLHFNSSICYRITMLVILLVFFFHRCKRNQSQHAALSCTKGSLKTMQTPFFT